MAITHFVCHRVASRVCIEAAGWTDARTVSRLLSAACMTAVERAELRAKRRLRMRVRPVMQRRMTHIDRNLEFHS